MAGSVEEAAGFIERLLGGAPCMVALDIDGTLTVERRRGSFHLHLGAVEALRRVEGLGVRTVLVTGNSAAVVSGVARYLGSRGPRVSENGCLVQWGGRLYSSCRGTARSAAEALEEELSHLLVPSWQNPWRLHDYAFLARSRSVDPGALLGEARRVLEERGLEAKLSSSGYALHVRPVDASKANGLRLAAELVGAKPGCVLALGDSAMDAEMAGAAGLLAAVGNAEEDLKRKAHLVVAGPSGEAAETLLRAVALLAEKERGPGSR